MTYKINKRGKLIPQDTKKPHNAVILCVDAAANSGYAIMLRGEVKASGEVKVKKPDDVRGVITIALRIAESSGVPCVLVLEKPWLGGDQYAVESLVSARRTWELLWQELAAPYKHKNKVHDVYVSTWRSAVLWQTTGEELPALEKAHASLLVKHDPGPDEAAAICIGVWASRAGEILALLPKAYWGVPV